MLVTKLRLGGHLEFWIHDAPLRRDYRRVLCFAETDRARFQTALEPKGVILMDEATPVALESGRRFAFLQREHQSNPMSRSASLMKKSRYPAGTLIRLLILSKLMLCTRMSLL